MGSESVNVTGHAEENKINSPSHIETQSVTNGLLQVLIKAKLQDSR